MTDALFARHAAASFACAAQLLGWRPHEFWAATPRELAAAFADPAGPQAAPPTRDWIAQMMERDGNE